MSFCLRGSSTNSGEPLAKKARKNSFFGGSPNHLCRSHKRSQKLKSLKTIVFLLFLNLFLSSPTYAFSIPEKPQSYVNDYANLLSADARGKIEEALAQFEKETSNQVVVALFRSLEGESLEDVSIRLAEKWRIGTKEHSNGVILLIFNEDRQMRIEVGYGLEGALPDAVCDLIIRHEIVPAFRKGDFDTGVLNGIRAILEATQGEYRTSGPDAEDKIEKASPMIFLALVLYLLIPIVCYVLVIGFLTFLGGSAGFVAGLLIVFVLVVLKAFLTSTFFGQTISRKRGTFWGPGGFSGGGFSGGGFGGGGGGGFGGGGASGRW